VRVVLDANVLVSALLTHTGSPAQLVERWLAGRFELVVCETLLAEVEGALVELRARVPAEVAAAFVGLIRACAEVTPDPGEPPAIRSSDPDDDYLIALAARERAPLVSGDRHLLALADRIPVRSPREFLDELE
jgi:putative PIN family toxin of toxin-antitoxin system